MAFSMADLHCSIDAGGSLQVVTAVKGVPLEIEFGEDCAIGQGKRSR
jgi:hypothetical protein